VCYGPCDVLLYITLPTLAIHVLNLHVLITPFLSSSLSLCLSPSLSPFASISASQSGWDRATEL
jgi:hypothetical protein